MYADLGNIYIMITAVLFQCLYEMQGYLNLTVVVSIR